MSTPATRPVIDWFEIPARDLDRAQRFYETVLGTTLKREPAGPGTTLAVIAHGHGPSAGCLMAGERAPQPSADGVVIYLNVDPSLDAAVARLEQAGGRVVVPKVVLPDGMGCFVHVLDTEGNRVGLHAAA